MRVSLTAACSQRVKEKQVCVKADHITSLFSAIGET